MRNLTILTALIAAVLPICLIAADNSEISSSRNFSAIKTIFSPTPVPSSTPKLIFNINSKIGIVDIHDDGTGCLRTKNANLAAKAPVSIIISLDEPPQKVLTATINKKLKKSCARRTSETGDNNPGKNYFYSLNLTESVAEEIGFEVGIAVIEPKNRIQIQNNLASFDLDEDGKPEFFRRCAGFEGIHFTVWTGKPLKGKRIWHSFYYLDYDTQENCEKKDWEETKN